MAENAKNTQKTSAVADTGQAQSTAETVVERAADLSDEVMKSVEAGQRAAIDAVRKFFDGVDEAIRGEGASRRQNVIDAALDMAEQIVSMQSGFVRSVARSADQAPRRPDDASQ
jgi:hypothetical protein